MSDLSPSNPMQTPEYKRKISNDKKTDTNDKRQKPAFQTKCEKPNSTENSPTSKPTGKIILLPCSNCKNKTVVYNCSCMKVRYCGLVCQKKHWESEHQYSDAHDDED